MGSSWVDLWEELLWHLDDAFQESNGSKYSRIKMWRVMNKQTHSQIKDVSQSHVASQRNSYVTQDAFVLHTCTCAKTADEFSFAVLCMCPSSVMKRNTASDLDIGRKTRRMLLFTNLSVYRGCTGIQNAND